MGAEELVSPGGPSAPVWAFLTAILTLVVTNIFQLISARTAAKEAARKAQETTEKVDEVRAAATTAADNTKNVSNGFSRNLHNKLDVIHTAVQDIESRLAEHITWHLNQEGMEHHNARTARHQEHEHRNRQ